MKFVGRFEKNVMLAEYVYERYSQTVEADYETNSKREITIANLLVGCLAEESVLFKLLNRDYITKQLYVDRLKLMIRELNAVDVNIKQYVDINLEMQVKEFISRD